MVENEIKQYMMVLILMGLTGTNEPEEHNAVSIPKARQMDTSITISQSSSVL